MYTPRRLFPHEIVKYQKHLLKLSPESRRLRFAYPISDEGIIEFCKKILKHFDQHVIYVVESDWLDVIGVGHISLEEKNMELAFSVLDDWQGHGIGNSLMARCLEYCRNRNIKKGYMVCLQSNQAIKHLCRKNGLALHTEHGETMADIELPNPTLITFFNEIATSNLAAFEHFSRTSKRITDLSIYALTDHR